MSVSPSLTSMLVGALATALLVGCSAPDDASPSSPPAQSDLQFEGVVRHLEIEGGAWVIERTDGTTFEPIGLPDDFKRDGLAVRVWADREEDRASIRMVGPIISIRHIERRE